MASKVIGQLKGGRFPMTIEWEITNVLYHACERSVVSPTFSFGNSFWCLELYPDVFEWNFSEGYVGEGYIGVSIMRKESGPPVSMTCQLFLKTTDGEEEILEKQKFTFEGEAKRSKTKAIKRSDLIEQPSKFMPSGVLTVVCYLHCDGTQGAENLCNDLNGLLVSSHESDISIKVKDEEFGLHRAIFEACSPSTAWFNWHAIERGKLIIEGKTKQILEIVGNPDHVLMVSKDRITAGDGVKAHDMEGKAVISTATTAKIFEYLNEVGIKTHFVRLEDEKSLLVKKCEMIPIEWVSRRYATGSFLKRNPGVKEGYRFSPLKLETFYKDDANHDPQWSDEQLICAELVVGGLKIGRAEVEIMHKTTACIFEVLEKAWASLDCSLIDMKVEYGVASGELVLADVIDSDSWRLWPSGDKRLMKDKQVYRNLTTVTPEDLEVVKRNFQWVALQVEKFLTLPKIQVIILMGSSSDKDFCQKIQKACKKLGVPAFMRVTSAHKGPDETLNIIAQYEGSGQPTVFIAVAGRSNGLGPVTSGNCAYPVINCPPVTADWGREDIWSSLRLPSGLGCTTVLSPEAAALAAAQILALTDHVVWSRLKAQQLNRWIDLKEADTLS